MTNSLQKIQSSLAKSIFGLAKDEANATGICIQCKLPALERCYSEAGKREYYISGLCEKCFDSIMGVK